MTTIKPKCGMNCIRINVKVIYIFYTLTMFCAGSDGENRFEPCQNVSNIPFWSWGFTRRCCEIYPHRIGYARFRSCESGDLRDTHYFMKKLITNSSIVYVASADIPAFIEVFIKLPVTVRIVLVTGIEDLGVPYEMFHPIRGEWKPIWGGKSLPITMREFILDPRLIRWYTQNYDLIGCNAFTCSDVTEKETAELIKKVIPIPIGLDFHTEAGKGGVLVDRYNMENHPGVCRQRHDIDYTTQSLPIFPSRDNRILSAFSCHLARSHHATRAELCKLLKDSTTNPSLNITITSRIDKREFWKVTGSHAFVLTPAGHGVDTHRLWEILNLHSVPIVLSSPMDRLYKDLPVIMVKEWKEVFIPGALQRFRAEIQSRFGSDPFASETVLSMLTAQYWVTLIRSEVERS
mmetsp:Transcript_18565/g.18647  ORF Transcript_18565/g.18647 Transcript_18565/m.18647 type:complete len:404 (-) Transcript_18565:189-1400(-)